MKKAPNPNFYFDNQAALLWNKDMLLFLEVADFSFQPWNATALPYAKQLAERAVKVLDNSYEYTNSTFLSNLKRATMRLVRKRRREHVEAGTRRREEVRPQSPRDVGRRGYQTSNTGSVRNDRKK